MQNILKTHCVFWIPTVAVFCLMLALHPAVAQSSEEAEPGRFYLVSVGVGDPDLITVRAIDTIKRSDIIICRPETRDLFAAYLDGKTFWDGAFREWRTHGKDCRRITDPAEREKCQSDRAVRDKLEQKIRDAVKAGKTVSVLGSGDLLIYGGPYRWYLEELKDLGVTLIPGVSCLNAANAALGADICDGRETRAAVLTTFREIDKLAPAHPTLVIFTMFTEFPDLVEKLKTHYPLQTPIAIVFYAGYKEKEHVLSGTLENILEKTSGKDFPFEHLVYVGDFLE